MRHDAVGVVVAVAVTVADASFLVLDVLLDRLWHQLKLLHTPIVQAQNERKDKNSQDHLQFMHIHTA